MLLLILFTSSPYDGGEKDFEDETDALGSIGEAIIHTFALDRDCYSFARFASIEIGGWAIVGLRREVKKKNLRSIGWGW